MVGEHVYSNWRSLIKPKRIERDAKSGETYGKFVVKPLERGFGITLGNALRRVLLSSLQGAAVTTVKIDGVLHEFSSIPGVIEDVTDIILNVKGILIRTDRTEPFNATIDIEGTAGQTRVVTAGDIRFDGAAEILNPDHPIATLDVSASRVSRDSNTSRLQVSSRSATAATSERSTKAPDSLSVSRMATGRPAASAW